METITAFRQQSFSDLSVCCTEIRTLEKICEKCVSFGYKVIAVNQIMEDLDNGGLVVPSKKRKLTEVETERVVQVVPEPIPLGNLQKKFQGKLQLLNRLTFYFLKPESAQKVLTNSITQKYDLLAVIPKSPGAFQTAASNLNVDIITFDHQTKYTAYMKRSSYNVAVSRGLYFELMYVPTMFGSYSRQRVISQGHDYFRCGKSKNVFISSYVTLPQHIKSPYDVIYAGLLFGLSEEKSKLAVSGAPTKIIRRAMCRKLGKAAPILVESIKNAVESNETDGDSNDDDDNDEK